MLMDIFSVLHLWNDVTLYWDICLCFLINTINSIRPVKAAKLPPTVRHSSYCPLMSFRKPAIRRNIIIKETTTSIVYTAGLRTKLF